MEPTTIQEYSSPRSFHFSEVYWGSSVLVLHSFGSSFLGAAIDLVFLGTDFVNLPFEVEGLRVSQPCGESEIQFEREFGITRKLEEVAGKRVFVIESSKTFRVIAAKMWVVVRTHHPELSLLPLLGQAPGERERFIDEHVKEWYRMEALYC